MAWRLSKSSEAAGDLVEAVRHLRLPSLSTSSDPSLQSLCRTENRLRTATVHVLSRRASLLKRRTDPDLAGGVNSRSFTPNADLDSEAIDTLVTCLEILGEDAGKNARSVVEKLCGLHLSKGELVSAMDFAAAADAGFVPLPNSPSLSNPLTPSLRTAHLLSLLGELPKAAGMYRRLAEAQAHLLPLHLHRAMHCLILAAEPMCENPDGKRREAVDSLHRALGVQPPPK